MATHIPNTASFLFLSWINGEQTKNIIQINKNNIKLKLEQTVCQKGLRSAIGNNKDNTDESSFFSISFLVSSLCPLTISLANCCSLASDVVENVFWKISETALKIVQRFKALTIILSSSCDTTLSLAYLTLASSKLVI